MPSYMSVLVEATDALTKLESTPPEYEYTIRNQVLFSLGVMFLELTYQAPLQVVRDQAFLARGQSLGLANYYTAQRLAERSNSRVSLPLKNIIKKCLHCDFGHSSDFKSPALQEAFNRGVIGGLDKLESVFRELPLDDS
ncbi:hypothetical protein BJY01DRAFT_252311 [Aspergillus pseudoustus]|uniref:Uncharacterized protein n=1 Tax=Aspergillus pseudoustus TaxID=1810923 RepID=A0ABR4J9X2_9EURO